MFFYILLNYFGDDWLIKEKNMKNILDLEKFLLLESKEDKTKRMLR